MNLEHAYLAENIEACEASIAASAAVLESMTECLTSGTGVYSVTWVPTAHPDEFDLVITSGQAIQPQHPTSPTTPRGLVKVATDGERANGRLAWVPGL